VLADVRLWTVRDYHRMVEAGILQPDERVELIEGQIIRMSPKGTAHEAAITRLERMLRRCLGDRVIIRLQSPIQLNDRSEPEPDVAVVKVDPLDYEDHHPTPSEVYLLIEVADSSLKFDCETKAQVYARSGIADYWVLDVSDRQLHVFRDPSQASYQTHEILEVTSSLRLLSFADVTMSIAAMFGKVS
jgi:Uma2 family endonuclease